MFTFNGANRFPAELPTDGAVEQIDVISDPPVIELWDAWAFAEVDAEMALRRWWEAPVADRGPMYVAYLAALQREEQAAKALQVRLAVSPGAAQWS